MPIAALAAASGLVAAGVVDRDSGTLSNSGDGGTTAATATVRRMDLVSQTQVNGTLVYAGTYPVVNRVDGTLTAVPRAGEVVRHGSVLYKIDGKPVILLRGPEPAHRTLARTMRGADVRQLNAELVRLGYANSSRLDPDSEYFTWATYYALKSFQEKAGLDATGTLGLGQAVFLDADEIRITTVTAAAGEPAPVGVIAEATSTIRQVIVALEVGQAGRVQAGDEVTVTLPDRTTTPGRVTSIGAVAKKGDSGSTTVDVVIELTNPGQTGWLDQAPVQVAIVSDSAHDVLAVPVTALLARSGGGYAIEVIADNMSRTLHPVELGLFDDSAGKVEIRSEGVTAGQKIVVPAA